MANKPLDEKRETGRYYTPVILADYLASNLLTKDSTKIFDPSYGEGALLLAAERFMQESRSGKFELFGCDIKPVNGLLKHLPEANLIKQNFLDFPTENKFTNILMNPPYVRHKNTDNEILKPYISQFQDFKILNKSADLWAFFLVKAIMQLKNGGSIGAIVPWAFLQADYAQSLRIFLCKQFEFIEFLSLSNEYFEGVQERVVLVWLKSYGGECKEIRFASSKEISSDIIYSNLPIEVWESNKVVFSEDIDIGELLGRMQTDFGFKKFENYASTRIGVVTGADEFFIRSRTDPEILEIPRNRKIPIITSSKILSTISINSQITTKLLILLRRGDYSLFKSFIQKGARKKFNQRVHSKNRKPWYAVKADKIPNGFFPYRISKIPFLVINSSRLQSTNSVHRIYFNNLTEIQIKWLQVSILSKFSQLSIEAVSKTYGRGMLKIEPGNLKQVLVLVKEDNCVNVVYDEISEILKNGNKEEAMRIATNFIIGYFNLSKSDINSFNAALSYCQEKRLG